MAEPSVKKRPRGEEETGPDEKEDDDESPVLERSLVFNDTLIALRMMHAQFPKFEKSLKKEKVLRLFKLNTGQDDHAIMFFEDYVNQMDFAVKKLGARNQHDMEVFEWFKVHVIESKLDVSIDHQELFILLSAGGDVTDEDITLLINAGLLTRQMIDPNMYWFAIPNIGSVLKGLSQGRKELLSFLNRRKYKEMLLASLEKKRLRLSPLDTRFHLRDLIGSGHLKVLQTPSGMLVRVSKD
ncbi:serine/threonine-protein kinase 19 homolog isoform X2 [Phalaenopsis equestris]|uniref:serine/threonine-protein kinase 19 homolog isoform X2 n=1 Tax=Phalaenopsis equestris TaxID=78828 RepID=UPI0009E1FD2A|nr:serine/threonine-protein kinase 19 homolog isoform X2 [Phalaenopsis equestris]